MEGGQAISIVPVPQDLTTQQAAELLGVSGPFLVKLLETRHLPYHLTGTHPRVYLKDLLAYKQHRDRVERMADEANKAGLYDKSCLLKNEFRLSSRSHRLCSRQCWAL